MTTLSELDANFVIDLTYEKRGLGLLLEELNQKGIPFQVRPGTSAKNVYVFARDIDEHLPDDMEKFDFVQKVIPLYESERSKRLAFLYKVMLKRRVFPKTGDLVELATLTRSPRMALYFAFQKTYTTWLVPLGLIGLAFRIFAKQTPWEFNMGYSITLLIWGISFALFWKLIIEPKYSRKLGYEAVIHVEDSKGVIIKKLCFVPIAATFTVCLMCFQFVCFFLEIYITQIYQGSMASILSLIPVLALSAYVPVLTMLYNVFVNKLVAWENSPDPEKSKVEKNFILTFLTSYVPLLITLFVYLPMGHLLNPQMNVIAKYSQKYHIPVINEDFKINTQRYQTQFFYFTVTNQVVALVLENFLPLILAKIIPIATGQSRATSEFSRASALVNRKYPEDSKIVEQVREYAHGPWGNFNVDVNIRKLVIQFGYVVMFSTIWPLAPLVCVVFNAIFSKFDIWRALKKNAPGWNKVTAREVGEQLVPLCLSPWDSVLEFLVWVASLVSPAIVIMYRHSSLPGVGFAKVDKREKWYAKSPIRYDWKLIFVYVMIAEHVCMLFHYTLSKILRAPNSPGKRSASQKIKDKLIEKKENITDLFPILQETENNMDGLCSRNSGTTASGANDTKTSEQRLDRDHLPFGTGARITAASDEGSLSQRGYPFLPQVAEPVPRTAEPVPITAEQIPSTTEPVPKTAVPSIFVAERAPNSDVPYSSLKAVNVNPSGNRSSSSISLGSSVAGATLPSKIPTSKNFDERQGYPTPTMSSNSTASMKISVNGAPVGELQNEVERAMEETPQTSTNLPAVEEYEHPILPIPVKDLPKVPTLAQNNISPVKSQLGGPVKEPKFLEVNQKSSLVTRKKSNSIKSITKLISTPLKKESNSDVKMKPKIKSPLDLLKKKF